MIPALFPAKGRGRAACGVAMPALLIALAAPLLALTFCAPAIAQGLHHPFAVGANEGALGNVQGLGAWLLAKESGFYRLLSTAIRSAKQSGTAAWGLAGLSLAYGVFHAAGPGHGKTVIAAYMLANERALRRGIGIAFGAALLQGMSAVAIVGVSALLFRATAKQMTLAANAVEIASYAGIVILGAILIYAKGAALLASWRLAPGPAGVLGKRAHSAACAQNHHHGKDCAHFHAPDPSMLGAHFSWKSAVLTMAAAGLRPCSGAILVLVFALAQKIFSAGVFAVAAMSLGTAATTSVLASTAVIAKKAAAKYAKPGSRRALVAGRLFEAIAAAAVFALGLSLLFVTLRGGPLAN